MRLDLLLSAIFASSAVAAPGGLAARVARRAAGDRSLPLVRLDAEETLQGADNDTQASYSSNWSGAVLTSPPSGTTFNTAIGRFTVPTPKKGTGSASSWSSSAWVGIDGDTYGNAILQAGVDFTVSSSGAVSFDSWYEWYPDYAYDFSGFSVTAGDVIEVSIVATTKSKGTVTLTNESTGKAVSKTLSAPATSASLGGQNAEWIVEDFESGGSLVPLSNWGTVTFTSAKAGTVAGGSVGLTGAEIINLKQSNKVLTDVEILSDSSVSVQYTG